MAESAEIRTMCLYTFTTDDDPRLVDTKRYRFRSLAQERMVADDYAERFCMKQDEGFIVIMDKNESMVLNKLNILP